MDVALPPERLFVSYVTQDPASNLTWNVTVPVGVPCDPVTVTLSVTLSPRLIVLAESFVVVVDSYPHKIMDEGFALEPNEFTDKWEVKATSDRSNKLTTAMIDRFLREINPAFSLLKFCLPLTKNLPPPLIHLRAEWYLILSKFFL